MDTSYELKSAGERPIVYVRPVNVADLPEELRQEAKGRTQVYAVHSEDGERLALVHDRKTAFLIANQNDLAPVNVH